MKIFLKASHSPSYEHQFESFAPAKPDFWLRALTDLLCPDFDVKPYFPGTFLSRNKISSSPAKRLADWMLTGCYDWLACISILRNEWHSLSAGIELRLRFFLFLEPSKTGSPSAPIAQISARVRCEGRPRKTASVRTRTRLVRPRPFFRPRSPIEQLEQYRTSFLTNASSREVIQARVLSSSLASENAFGVRRLRATNGRERIKYGRVAPRNLECSVRAEFASEVTSFQRDMQRKQQQNQNLSARMPKHEQQRQTATAVDDRYNGGAGASGNTYAQQGVGGYAQQVSSPFPLVSHVFYTSRFHFSCSSCSQLAAPNHITHSLNIPLSRAQGYYYQDANTQQQYADTGYGAQAYQQQLAYAGVSSNQPYWYPSFEEGSNAAVQNGGASQEMSVAMKDRDIKTQRRKEANRESARRSKQRKKEESELLSSKAQELVRESATLRAELEKVQKHVDSLYEENTALRKQISKAGGSLPPAPARISPVNIPPPIELPASLLKDATQPIPTGKKDTAPKTATRDSPAAENKRRGETQKTQAAAKKTRHEAMEDSTIGLPGLLDSDLADQIPLSPSPGPTGYAGLTNTGTGEANGMMLSEAIVSFREPARGSLFPPNAALDESDIMLGGRNTPNFIGGKTLTDDDLTIVNFVRRGDIGQGG